MNYEAQKYEQLENLVLEFAVDGGEYELGSLNDAETEFMDEILNQYGQEIETTSQLDSLQRWVRMHRDELHLFTDVRIYYFIRTF